MSSRNKEPVGAATGIDQLFVQTIIRQRVHVPVAKRRVARIVVYLDGPTDRQVRRQLQETAADRNVVRHQIAIAGQQYIRRGLLRVQTDKVADVRVAQNGKAGRGLPRIGGTGQYLRRAQFVREALKMAKGFAGEFHRTAFVSRNAHWKSGAMVEGENAKGQHNLFQAAVATDSSRLCFGVGKGTNSESSQHDPNGNHRDQFNPSECRKSAALVERGHIRQGIANRLVATPESCSAFCRLAESDICTLPSPRRRLPLYW